MGPIRLHGQKEGLGVKVLFFSHQADFIYGGEIVTLSFMRELSRQGVEVHFASPGGPYHERAGDLVPTHLVNSVQFSRRILGLPRLGAALWRARRELAAFADELDVHVVHATSLKAMVYASGLRRPVVWHHHDILPPKFTNSLWVRALASSARRILCPSEATRASLLEAGVAADRAFVLRNGFRLEDWASRPPRKEGAPLRLGFVGELSPRKGVDRIAEILAALPSDARAELTLVGEGLSDPEYAAKVRRQLEPLGAKFLGRRSDVKALYQEIDLLLVPSRQDPLPTVIVEAGLSGVPVIGARAGGIPEMVVEGKNGFLFKNAAEAADAVIRARDIWPELSQGARTIALDRYDIEKLSADLIRHYREVCDGA